MSVNENGNEDRARPGIPVVPRRIAVIRALQLGDLLCAIPTLRAMRDAWPSSEITLVGLAWARSLVSRFHKRLNGFLEFPGLPGLPESAPDPDREAAFQDEAAGRGFDLAIQMHGDGSITNQALPLLAARFNAGFYPSNSPCPDPAWFTEYPNQGHEIRRLLKLVDFLGLPRSGDELEFPLFGADRSEAAAIKQREGLAPRQYVCLHPGARDPLRQWPLARFAQVAEILAGRGFRVVVTGVEEERDLADVVARAVGTAAVNLAGHTTLGGLAALMTDARLLICNDTGVSHVASALGVPSVVIFSGSDPERWAPLNNTLHRAVFQSDSPQSGPVALSQVMHEVDRLPSGDPERVALRNGPLV